MFQPALTRGFWRAEERGPWVASLAAALALHVGAMLILLYVLAMPRPAAPADEDAMWFDLGLPGPSGGGGETPIADAGPSVLEEKPAAEPPPPVEELAIPVPELALRDTMPPDTLEEADTEGPIDALPTGAVAQQGVGANVGRGGGAGGGEGGGIGPGQGPGTGGGGARPLHIVVPRLPRGVDPRVGHGKWVALLLEIRPDGSVGEVRIERASGIPALDRAALAAARGMRYTPDPAGDTGHARWTRTEIRF